MPCVETPHRVHRLRWLATLVRGLREMCSLMQTFARHSFRRRGCAVVASVGQLCGVFFFLTLCSSFAASTLSFNRDVRPILSENCFACHGFDAKKREAGLRLDIEEGAKSPKDGVYPIKAGDAVSSEVWRRIVSEDADEVMPPPKAHKTLSKAQKETLREWISQGAPYQKHWSLESPMLRKGATVDGLLSQRLMASGGEFAVEADRATLIRRVAFTLTGLPPTMEEIDAFVRDVSSDAYERMVDRYLASPRYGEEMARHWLDVARYADTHGLHLDNERNMWAYRDWVIRAFNDNLPFDRFTVWQIAGDLLPEPTVDQRIATGFSRCNVTTSEGGAIDDEYRHLYAVDRTATLTTAWLGLTGGCAQCHDHKYDPLSTAEFYSLYAFFFNAADPPMDKNINTTDPYLRLPLRGEQERLDRAIRAEHGAVEALERWVGSEPVALDERRGFEVIRQVLFDDVFAFGSETRNTTRNASDWVDMPAFGARSGRRVLRLSNGQFSQESFSPVVIPVLLGADARLAVWVRLDDLNVPRAVSVEVNGVRGVWGDGSVFQGTPYVRENDVLLGPRPEPGEWVRLEVDLARLNLKAGSRINTLSVQQFGGTAFFDLCEVQGRHEVDRHPLTSFEAWWKFVSSGKKNLPDVASEISAVATTDPAGMKDPDKREKLYRFYRAHISRSEGDVHSRLRAAWESARSERSAADQAISGTFVFRDSETAKETFVAMRGVYNKLGERVEPGTPASLPPLKRAGVRATRLDLANWLVTPENPLTARVTVNRFWQQVFGVGIVATSHDLGSQGETPSHPELLDHLAVMFREGGWDVKALMKGMVMTRAFRQGAKVTPRMLAVDPMNRLLGRGPRIRLDAEQIRDNALFVSGLIKLAMGGRGVRSYQPPNIWEPVGYGDSNTRYYLQDHGDALYRRTIYAFLKRTAPPPFMSNFDAPNREQSCTRRERSNTPLQALQLMNDVQHFEAARALAERVLGERGMDENGRIGGLFRRVLSREPDAAERGMLMEALTRQRQIFRKDPSAAERVIRNGESKPLMEASVPEMAAWTLLANLVLNLDETVTRN